MRWVIIQHMLWQELCYIDALLHEYGGHCMVELVLIFLFLYLLIKEYTKNIMTGENMVQSFETLDLSVFFFSLLLPLPQVLWSRLKINLQMFFYVFRSEKIWQKLMEFSSMFLLKLVNHEMISAEFIVTSL